MFDPVLVGRSWVSATNWVPLAKLLGVQKNKHGHNFQNIGPKMNQRLVILYDLTLICFGSDILIIVAVLVFFDGSFQLQFFFRKQGKLRPPVTQPKTPSTPLCHTYSEPPGCEDSPGGIQNIPYLYKKLSKSRLSDPFFGCFRHF